MPKHFVNVLIDIKMPDGVPADGGGTTDPSGETYIEAIIRAGATAQGYTVTKTEPYSREHLNLGSLFFRIS